MSLFQFFTWFITVAFLKVINLFKSIILEPSTGLSFYSFLIFITFGDIFLHVINYLKYEQEIEQKSRNKDSNTNRRS